MKTTITIDTGEPDLRGNLSLLCETILDMLIDGNRIQHSMLEKLMSILVSQIFEMGNDLGNVFDELSDAIKIAYQTADFSKEYDQGFEMGVLYSMMFSVEQYKQKQREDSELEELKKYVENEYRARLIHIIEKTEGISQTDILDSYNESFHNKTIKKARLSQILTEMKERKIVYCISAGKEKYYYLTRRGKLLADYAENNIIVKQSNLSDEAVERVLELCRMFQDEKYVYREEYKTTATIDGLSTFTEWRSTQNTYKVACG